MEGKASIQIGNANDKDKQKISITYYLGPFDDIEEAQSAKYALDKIASAYGADINQEAKIIGQIEDKAAQEDAESHQEEASSNE